MTQPAARTAAPSTPPSNRHPTLVRASLLAAALGLSFVAVAQTKTPHDTPRDTARDTPPAHAGQAGHPAQHAPEHHAAMAQRHAERHAERQAALKAALQLTPAQEAAWQRFATATQPPSPRDAPHRSPSADGLTTPERLDRMEAFRAERERAMTERHAAIRAFYGQLTPSQQKTFDAQAWPPGRHAGPLPHRHGPHPRDGQS